PPARRRSRFPASCPALTHPFSLICLPPWQPYPKKANQTRLGGPDPGPPRRLASGADLSIAAGQPGAIGVTSDGYRCASCATESSLIARHSLRASLLSRSTGWLKPASGEPGVGTSIETPDDVVRWPRLSARCSSCELLRSLSTATARTTASSTCQSVATK